MNHLLWVKIAIDGPHVTDHLAPQNYQDLEETLDARSH